MPSGDGNAVLVAGCSGRWPQVDGLSMDIAAYASAQKASQVQSDMSVGVLSKLLDQQKAQGVATAKLIAGAAVRPQEPGKGGSVDVTA